MTSKLWRKALGAGLGLVAMLNVAATPAIASIESEMTSFFNGTMVNTTSPSAYRTQAASYYSLGGIYARNQVKNANLVTVQAPSLKMGCGGIDVFAGGFSYINAGELVSMMKAIGSNALGLAFKMGIETICPMCAKTIEELRSMAQDMNSLNINSCNTAQALVGGMFGKNDQSESLLCQAVGDRTGRFSDRVAAWNGCGNGATRKSVMNNLPAEVKSIYEPNTNYAWKALKDGRAGVWDRDMAQLIMTLTGTLITKPGAEAEAGPVYTTVPQGADSNAILNALFDGSSSTIRVLSCEAALPSGEDRCVAPTVTERAFNSANSMKARVSALVDSMLAKTEFDQAPSESELRLLNSTSLPLYKIINVISAYSPAGTMIDLDLVKEVVALDLLYQFVRSQIEEVDRGMSVLKLRDPEQLESFKKQLGEARRAIESREAKERDKREMVFRIIERTQYMEGILAQNMTGALANAFNMSKR